MLMLRTLQVATFIQNLAAYGVIICCTLAIMAGMMLAGLGLIGLGQ